MEKAIKDDALFIAGHDEKALIKAFFTAGSLGAGRDGYGGDEYGANMFPAFVGARGLAPVVEFIPRDMSAHDQQVVSSRRWRNICLKACRIKGERDHIAPGSIGNLDLALMSSVILHSARFRVRLEAGQPLPEAALWADVEKAIASGADAGPGVADSFDRLKVLLARGETIESLLAEKTGELVPVLLAFSSVASVRQSSLARSLFHTLPSENGSFMVRIAAQHTLPSENGSFMVSVLGRNTQFSEEGYRGVMDDVIKSLDEWATASRAGLTYTPQWQGVVDGCLSQHVERLCDLAKSRGWSLAPDQREALDLAAGRALSQLHHHEMWLARKPNIGRGSVGTRAQQDLVIKWRTHAAWAFARIVAAASDPPCSDRCMDVVLHIARHRGIADTMALRMEPSSTPVVRLLASARGDNWLRLVEGIATSWHALQPGQAAPSHPAWASLVASSHPSVLGGVPSEIVSASIGRLPASPPIRGALKTVARTAPSRSA